MTRPRAEPNQFITVLLLPFQLLYGQNIFSAPFKKKKKTNPKPPPPPKKKPLKPLVFSGNPYSLFFFPLPFKVHLPSSTRHCPPLPLFPLRSVKVPLSPGIPTHTYPLFETPVLLLVNQGNPCLLASENKKSRSPLPFRCLFLPMPSHQSGGQTAGDRHYPHLNDPPCPCRNRLFL